ncbi:MAG: pilus assembly protein PilO [Deltaproteobacteria bacterium]|nr:MAG: pilus assembly protein PilO [Desulfobacterales bacterium]PIE73027.1 MAG: pilus assembly protein PilO [Deltaproteobacteria bacterium]
MKTNNTAISNFISEKYIPLEKRNKVAILILLLLLPVVIFYFAFYQHKADQITALTNQTDRLKRQIQEAKIKAAEKERFERELAEAEILFEEKSVLLPKESEIPKLLKDISSLGRNAGLDFLTFRPKPDVPKDFYAEIPITINVRGPYHNMGFFFDQVSKLKRIVSVTNIDMKSPKKEGGEMLLKSDCTLVTYRFTNVALPKEPKK